MSNQKPGSQTVFGLPIGFVGERGTILQPNANGPLPDFGYGDEGLARMDKIIDTLWPAPTDQSGETDVT